MLGFPKSAVDVEQLKLYAVDAYADYESGVSVQDSGDRVLVTFSFCEEERGGWMDEGEAESWMPSMIQLRADIMNGDLRAMYVGWLAGARRNQERDADQDEDDDEYDDEGDSERAEALERVEPPVPDGLGTLTAPLRTLAEFLSLDDGTISVAAERSGKLSATESDQAQMTGWIASLPPGEKDRLLQRVMSSDVAVAAELRNRFRAALRPARAASHPTEKGRTVRELVQAGQVRMVELERQKAAEEKRLRQERSERLAPHEEASWRRVESLIDLKQAHPYDEATNLLKDLADLAEYKQQPRFRERLAGVRARHKAKTSFIERLNKAGLR